MLTSWLILTDLINLPLNLPFNLPISSEFIYNPSHESWRHSLASHLSDTCPLFLGKQWDRVLWQSPSCRFNIIHSPLNGLLSHCPYNIWDLVQLLPNERRPPSSALNILLPRGVLIVNPFTPNRPAIIILERSISNTVIPDCSTCRSLHSPASVERQSSPTLTSFPVSNHARSLRSLCLWGLVAPVVAVSICFSDCAPIPTPGASSHPSPNQTTQ